MIKTTDLQHFATERGIRHFMVSFTDLFGAQRAKLIPAEAIGQVMRNGAAFAGFATWFDLTAAHPDLVAVPDAQYVVQLPWQPEIAWIPSNCRMDGAEFEQAPRNVLRRVVAQAASLGFRLKTGVEPEFFLLNPETSAPHDVLDRSDKPCYDQQAIMRRFGLLSEIMDFMTGLGWRPYQCDHEDARGQFEMNWDFDDALITADRHAFFKFMLRSVAERHGMCPSFLPKPFAGQSGSGCHIHLSLWDPSGETNLFLDPEGELGLSRLGRHFLGGIISHATALAALCNPTVNSYKRINMPRTESGSSWAPGTVTWSGNNRTHMVRVPGPGRFELRLPDSAVNPYLLQAAVLAAGLDGIAREIDPGPHSSIDMYAESHRVPDAPRLPADLLDAIREFERDETLRAALGEDFSAAYIKLKYREWQKFAVHFQEWEKMQMFDL